MTANSVMKKEIKKGNNYCIFCNNSFIFKRKEKEGNFYDPPREYLCCKLKEEEAEDDDGNKYTAYSKIESINKNFDCEDYKYGLQERTCGNCIYRIKMMIDNWGDMFGYSQIQVYACSLHPYISKEWPEGEKVEYEECEYLNKKEDCLLFRRKKIKKINRIKKESKKESKKTLLIKILKAILIITTIFYIRYLLI